MDGAKLVRIFGQKISVRAGIHTVGGLSAQADQAGLLDWPGHFKQAPQQTFVVHGESATAIQFAGLVRQEMNWNVQVPSANETVRL